MSPAISRDRLLNPFQKMKDLFEKELQKFDSDRVLPAWDALVTRQQAALEEAAVPAMFESNETATRAVS